MPFSSGNDLRLTAFLQCGFRAERHNYWPKSKARIFSGGGFLQQKKKTHTDGMGDTPAAGNKWDRGTHIQGAREDLGTWEFFQPQTPIRKV